MLSTPIIVGLCGAVLWQINAGRSAGQAKRSIVDLRQSSGAAPRSQRRRAIGDLATARYLTRRDRRAG
jgi:hypothetical protein